MRFSLSLIVLFLLISKISKTQSILDKEFQWINYEDCLALDTKCEVFVKVQKDPVLVGYTSSEFNDFCNDLIESLKLGAEQNGVLKLKILFTIDKELCLKDLGLLELNLSKEQRIILADGLNPIKRYECGQQRNHKVNCIGILYLTIKEGKFEQYRNVNFEL